MIVHVGELSSCGPLSLSIEKDLDNTLMFTVLYKLKTADDLKTVKENITNALKNVPGGFGRLTSQLFYPCNPLP